MFTLFGTNVLVLLIAFCPLCFYLNFFFSSFSYGANLRAVERVRWALFVCIGCFWPARYLPPYNIDSYIGNPLSYPDTFGVSMLHTSGSSFTVPIGPFSRNTAVSMCSKRWKNWAVGRASVTKAACHEIYSPFVQGQEDVEYELGLLAALAHKRFWFTELTVVATNLLWLPKYSVYFYFVANRSCCANEFHIGARVLNRQQQFAGWQNVECFSMLVSD